MTNKPFKFISSEKQKSELFQNLEKIGLHLVEEETDYKERSFRLDCPWKSKDSIEVKIFQKYWPDGIELEDDQIQFIVNGNVKGELKISELLNEKLSLPLREKLEEDLLKLASSYTNQST